MIFGDNCNLIISVQGNVNTWNQKIVFQKLSTNIFIFWSSGKQGLKQNIMKSEKDLKCSYNSTKTCVFW